MGNFIDLTGKRFGRLYVVRRYGYVQGKSIITWECLCDCGNIVIVRGSALRSGNTRSCGCYCKERTSEAKTKNLQGRKFGRLTILERCGSTQRGTALWECLCDCGEVAIVRGVCLVKGHTQSCGCLQREKAAATVRGKFGSIHPAWRGGKSSGTYPPEFNGGLKRTIRERDDYKCGVCWLYGNNVHHIDYDKQNSNPANLITLCKSCHNTTNVNRDYWQTTLTGLVGARERRAEIKFTGIVSI